MAILNHVGSLEALQAQLARAEGALKGAFEREDALSSLVAALQREKAELERQIEHARRTAITSTSTPAVGTAS